MRWSIPVRPTRSPKPAEAPAEAAPVVEAQVDPAKAGEAKTEKPARKPRKEK